MNKNFYCLPLHSDLMNISEAELIINKFHDTLVNTSGFLVKDDNINTYETLLYFIITGGTENLFLNLHETRKKHFPQDPVYLIAHSGNNSLPASLEILARIKQEGLKGKIIYLSGNSKNDKDMLLTSLRNLEVYKKLKQTRIGLIGKPSDWLIASSPDLSAIQKTWGISVEEYEFARLKKEFNSVNKSEINNHYNKFRENAKSIIEPNDNDLINSAKVYHAIKKISTENNLQSVSVRCFDILASDCTTGCFALSQLTDEGIIAGCEGDIVSTITMLWTNLISGKSPWMANPARVDINENRLILAHCTVPTSMVSEYDIRSHFESGKGVGIQGKMEIDPVTLVRLGGKDMKLLWLAEGEIINTGKEENLCRTQVEIRLHDRNKLKELLHNPLGNHLVLIHGFYAEDLEEWHNEFIM